MKDFIMLGVYREKRFSPGKVEDDAAILDMTLAALANMGCKVVSVDPESLHSSTPRPECVVTMAQSPGTLAILDEWQRQGTRMINSTASIRNCYRKPLTRLLTDAGIKTPCSQIVNLEKSEISLNLHSLQPIWLKRGDVHAMQEGDVVLLKSPDDLTQAMEHFRRHEIKDVLLQEHIDGEVIKFYGVGQKEYFKAFLAATGEDVTLQVGPLRELAEAAARAVGIEIYGGDAVLTPDNKCFLIDLNDWPSFSRCCRDAAASIASYVINEMGSRQ